MKIKANLVFNSQEDLENYIEALNTIFNSGIEAKYKVDKNSSSGIFTIDLEDSFFDIVPESSERL